MVDADVIESINEMSETELRENCIRYADDQAFLTKQAGLTDESVTLQDLTYALQVQGIEWVIEALSKSPSQKQMSMSDVITLLSFYRDSLQERSEEVLNTMN